MRERQQMASRPFASVAMALEAECDQVELLQGGIEVSVCVSVCVHICLYKPYASVVLK